ncbi:hypothetical protein MPTK1_5g14620 [Marchantia polymorpha subsp. ruderalis]|uniref:Uncharacterized protein n=2 Tax=Marchantia polymorpha TaxID=3197 RepID=A0AAF6BIE0_MARPO|nr:hypothetical protein MARPO_0032s0154 [Marchantia polymorpha]BBN11774.1 hypothetical protein Mp_5g14620 [Marchantia polymorpha subsp. ruderalis]|eukprot:PTQ41992.1 hypothetical protein MARPO_0032s0154 [Marchantia polymorpha]
MPPIPLELSLSLRPSLTHMYYSFPGRHGIAPLNSLFISSPGCPSPHRLLCFFPQRLAGRRSEPRPPSILPSLHPLALRLAELRRAAGPGVENIGPSPCCAGRHQQPSGLLLCAQPGLARSHAQRPGACRARVRGWVTGEKVPGATSGPRKDERRLRELPSLNGETFRCESESCRLHVH